MFSHKKHTENFRKPEAMHPETLKMSQNTNYLARCYQKIGWGNKHTLKRNCIAKKSL